MNYRFVTLKARTFSDSLKCFMILVSYRVYFDHMLLLTANNVIFWFTIKVVDVFALGSSTFHKIYMKKDEQ